MPKYNKVYPSFYNGVSQQIPELMHETNCLEMVNCIPDLINGATKRPPAKFTAELDIYLERSRIFHTYDRGEDEEEYMFACSTQRNYGAINISLPDGTLVELADTSGGDIDYFQCNEYTELKAVTIQDTTFVINTTKVVGIEDDPTQSDLYTDASTTMSLNHGIIATEFNQYAQYTITANITLDGVLYTRTSGAYTWAEYNTYIYTYPAFQETFIALINSISGFSATANGANYITITKSDKSGFTASTSGSTVNVTVGTLLQQATASVSDAISSVQQTTSAFYWAKRASGDDLHQWRYVVYLDGVTYEAVHHESDTAMDLLAYSINNSGVFSASRVGSILKIDRRNGQEFTFDSWDSWGDQASFGWKGSVAKLTDLPNDLGWNGHVVQITGTDDNDFTDYFVRSTDSAWQETRDPNDSRGVLTNMPQILERRADGKFALRSGEWELPKVGSTETNPTPSFVGSRLTDVFFYKNRLGLASEDNIVMSELGGYYNFYIKSVLSILDTDPIDIAISAKNSNSIQHAIPFQSSLFIFTKESQYELTYNGTLSPTTVSVDLVSAYPMATRVRPVVSGDSLYFISKTRRKQQLRHYAKNNDTLTVAGTDLSLTTPTFLANEITNLLVNEVLGYVICATATFEVYLYNYRENSSQRVQSAWSTWEFFQGLNWDDYSHYKEADQSGIQYSLIGSNMYITVGAVDGGGE